MSRVGLKSITLIDKVTVTETNGLVVVEGPKGKLDFQLPRGIGFSAEGNEVTITRADESRQVRALHGTARSLVNNMIIGVSTGYSKDLEIIGVGFRAKLAGKALDLSLGKSHPILHPIPEGIKVTVDGTTKLKVEGIDKQAVGQFAAEVRAYYKPEPYKGKGIRYVGEYVRRKAGKSVGK